GVAAALAVAFVDAAVVVGGDGLPAVVGELVVVPDRDQRRAFKQLLQYRIGAHRAMQLAVVVERVRRVIRTLRAAKPERARSVVEDDAALAVLALELRVTGGL